MKNNNDKRSSIITTKDGFKYSEDEKKALDDYISQLAKQSKPVTKTVTPTINNSTTVSNNIKLQEKKETVPVENKKSVVNVNISPVQNNNGNSFSTLQGNQTIQPSVITSNQAKPKAEIPKDLQEINDSLNLLVNDKRKFGSTIYSSTMQFDLSSMIDYEQHDENELYKNDLKPAVPRDIISTTNKQNPQIRNSVATVGQNFESKIIADTNKITQSKNQNENISAKIGVSPATASVRGNSKTISEVKNEPVNSNSNINQGIVKEEVDIDKIRNIFNKKEEPKINKTLEAKKNVEKPKNEIKSQAEIKPVPTNEKPTKPIEVIKPISMADTKPTTVEKPIRINETIPVVVEKPIVVEPKPIIVEKTTVIETKTVLAEPKTPIIETKPILPINLPQTELKSKVAPQTSTISINNDTKNISETSNINSTVTPCISNPKPQPKTVVEPTNPKTVPNVVQPKMNNESIEQPESRKSVAEMANLLKNKFAQNKNDNKIKLDLIEIKNQVPTQSSSIQKQVEEMMRLKEESAKKNQEEVHSEVKVTESTANSVSATVIPSAPGIPKPPALPSSVPKPPALPKPSGVPKAPGLPKPGSNPVKKQAPKKEEIVEEKKQTTPSAPRQSLLGNNMGNMMEEIMKIQSKLNKNNI